MNACQVLLDNKELMRASGLLLVLGAEFWLGKTDKIQASSILELVLNLLMKKKSPEDTNGKGV